MKITDEQLTIITKERPCPRCGKYRVYHFDSLPESEKGYIKETCVNCGREVTWSKLLIL